jgi:hypothetical protein
MTTIPPAVPRMICVTIFHRLTNTPRVDETPGCREIGSAHFPTYHSGIVDIGSERNLNATTRNERKE